MAKQSKEELDKWYEKNDPWGYVDSVDDKNRKRIILDALSPFAPFKRALDIGCGEGFITKDLPAKEIHGIEISDNAAERLPKNVKRVEEPQGFYDLIVCTGMLYDHYDHHQFADWIKQYAKGYVLTCNISEWEVNPLPSEKEIHTYEFGYRTYTQKLRLYKFE